MKKINLYPISKLCLANWKNTGNKSVGKQDQWAAAFGGLKYYQFNKDGSVYVEKIELKPETLEALQIIYIWFTLEESINHMNLDEQAKE